MIISVFYLFYRFGDFYHGNGFDVLHIKIKPGQLLWPRAAQKVMREVSIALQNTVVSNRMSLFFFCGWLTDS